MAAINDHVLSIFSEEVLTKEQARKGDSRLMSESSESQAHVISNDLVVNPMAVLTKPVGNGYRLNVPERYVKSIRASPPPSPLG